MDEQKEIKNVESVITRYNEQGELILVGIKNMKTKTRAVEFYKCEAVGLEEANNLIK